MAGWLGGQPLERLFAVVDDVDVVALGLEVEAQAVREVLFVFDDEEAAHGGAAPGVTEALGARGS